MNLKLLAGLLTVLILIAGCTPGTDDMNDDAAAVEATMDETATDADAAMDDTMEDGEAMADEAMEDTEAATEDMADDMTDMADPFVTFDTDADGSISEDEYNAGIGNFDTELAFADIDGDADGFITEDEFGLFSADFGM